MGKRDWLDALTLVRGAAGFVEKTNRSQVRLVLRFTVREREYDSWTGENEEGIIVWGKRTGSARP